MEGYSTWFKVSFITLNIVLVLNFLRFLIIKKKNYFIHGKTKDEINKLKILNYDVIKSYKGVLIASPLPPVCLILFKSVGSTWYNHEFFDFIMTNCYYIVFIFFMVYFNILIDLLYRLKINKNLERAIFELIQR